MEEKKTKKKKLTLSVSSNKPHNVPQYSQHGGKTSVVIEKKSSKRWGEKKFQPQNNKYRSRSNENFIPKKPPIAKNFDIRKLAEERATRRFKNIQDDLSSKKVHKEKIKVLFPKEKINSLYQKF